MLIVTLAIYALAISWPKKATEDRGLQEQRR
jgi:hypothetical protein